LALVAKRMKKVNSSPVERLRLVRIRAVSRLLDRMCARTGTPRDDSLPRKLGNCPSRAMA
jgi:hypothetical protein